MIVRQIGCVLLLSACVSAAFVRLKFEKNHLLSVSSIADMLELMHGELLARSAPLPELTDYLSEKTSGQAFVFLINLKAGFKRLGKEDFSVLWDGAVNNADYLNVYERQELSRLGKILGRCDLETQAAAIKRTEEIYRREIESTRKELPQKRKLIMGVYGCFGIILLIVLL